MNTPPRKALERLFFILRKTVVFLTAFLLLVFALYGFGSINLYQDENLFLLLKIISGAGSLLFVFLGFYVISVLARAFTEKNPRLLRHLGLFAASFLISLALVLFTQTLAELSAGWR